MVCRRYRIKPVFAPVDVKKFLKKVENRLKIVLCLHFLNSAWGGLMKDRKLTQF